jgi:hypothetical protein
MPRYRIVVQHRSVITYEHVIEVPEGQQHFTTDAECMEIIDKSYAEQWVRTTKTLEPDAGYPHTEADVIMEFEELP